LGRGCFPFALQRYD